jgi:hypothetical protein
VSNFEVFSKLLDVDNHDEDTESAFGGGDWTWGDILNGGWGGGGGFSFLGLGCRVWHKTQLTVLE